MSRRGLLRWGLLALAALSLVWWGARRFGGAGLGRAGPDGNEEGLSLVFARWFHDVAIDGPRAGSGSSQRDAAADLGSLANPLGVELAGELADVPLWVANGSSDTTRAGSAFARLGLSVRLLPADARSFFTQAEAAKRGEETPTMGTKGEWTRVVRRAQVRGLCRVEPLPRLNAGGARSAEDAGGVGTRVEGAAQQAAAKQAVVEQAAVALLEVSRGSQAIVTLAPSALGLGEAVALHGLGVVNSSQAHAFAEQTLGIVGAAPAPPRPDDGLLLFADLAGLRQALVGKRLRVVALGDPELSVVLRQMPEARVAYSTRAASHSLFAAVVCERAMLERRTHRRVFERFVAGCLQGAKEAQQRVDETDANRLALHPRFAELATQHDTALVETLSRHVLWTDLADNLRLLGLAGGTNHYERMRDRFAKRSGPATDSVTVANDGASGSKTASVWAVPPFDTLFLRLLAGRYPAALPAAQEPEFRSASGARSRCKAGQRSLISKRVVVPFAGEEATLSARAQRIIDVEVVPFVEMHGAAHVIVAAVGEEVASNGSAAGAAAEAAARAMSTTAPTTALTNGPTRARAAKNASPKAAAAVGPSAWDQAQAMAVVEYLVHERGQAPERFVVRGDRLGQSDADHPALNKGSQPVKTSLRFAIVCDSKQS